MIALQQLSGEAGVLWVVFFLHDAAKMLWTVSKQTLRAFDAFGSLTEEHWMSEQLPGFEELEQLRAQVQKL